MSTKRSNLIYVDQLQDAIPGAFAGATALNGNGMAIVRTDLPTTNPGGGRIKGGDTIRIPYWDVIGELEDVNENEALTPVNMSATYETATIKRSGRAGEITNWAQLTAMATDPYKELAAQIATSVMRRVDKGLIDELANVPSGQINDQSANSITGVANGGGFLYFVNTLDLLGDEQADVVGWVMHSRLLTALRTFVDSLGRPLFIGLGNSNGTTTLYEKPVYVSDRMTTSGTGSNTVYTTAVVKRNALAAWIDGNPTIKADSDILVDSDLQALNVYWTTHLYKRDPTGKGVKTGAAVLKCKF